MITVKERVVFDISDRFWNCKLFHNNCLLFACSKQFALFFSRRFRRKSTTLTVASFFSQFHFFCSFVQLLGREVNPVFLGSEKHRGETKGSPLCGFFRHYATFFRNFLNYIKGYTLEFSEVFGL